jgi:esterase/lipase
MYFKIIKNQCVFWLLFVSFFNLNCSAKDDPLFQPLQEAYSYSWEEKGIFADYIKETKRFIRKTRYYVDPEKKDFEIDINSPFEMKPNPQYCKSIEKPKKGILLIHGLGDSPFSMRDVASWLSKRCYLVRTILLPGHGSRPGETLRFSAKDWYRVSRFALKTLKKDVKEVYAGGFSTGANISTFLAYEDLDIKGLILFSPAFSLKYQYPNLVAFVNLFTNYLFKSQTADNYARYRTHSLHGLRQFYQTSENILEAFKNKSELKIPVFIALSEDDYVVDVQFIKKTITNEFTHPASRLMLFGREVNKRDIKEEKRIILKESNLPQKKIYGFSHTSIPISGFNSHYGENADFYNCWMVSDADKKEICKKNIDKTIWFTELRLDTPNENRIYARLTYNPYFEEMMKTALKVLKNGEMKNE